GEVHAVGEVHAHVAHLHLGAGDLGAEAHGHALIGLDPDHDRVLAQVHRVGGAEGQERGALEHQRDLGDPTTQTLTGPEVERHPGPAAGGDVQAHRGIGLGGGVGGDAVLLDVGAHLLTALPAAHVLTAGGVGRE